MISTRTHALIDYGVAAGLGAAALCPAFPARLRLPLGAAAAYHAGYSAATDYEGGVVRRLDMVQHLRLDVLGAAALLGAGLLMRRRFPAEGRALVAIGVAECLVVGLSARSPGEARPQMAYPPLDVLKPVAADLWVVDSVIGPGAPVRMTVVRLPGRELLLHSPTRFDPRLRRSLERLGRIRHLVAPNIVHWVFMKEWQDAVPGAVTWGAPGLRDRSQVRRSGLGLDHDLGEQAPGAWSRVIEHAVIPGGAGFSEVALFHRPSRTLLLTDLVISLERHKVPLLLRPIAGLLGVIGPAGKAVAYLRAVVSMKRRQAKTAALRVIGWAPERVIFAHGRPFEHDATLQLRRSLEWLIR